MQNIVDDRDFDGNDIVGTLRVIMFRLGKVESAQNKFTEILEPIIQERQIEIEIKKKSQENKEKRKSTLQLFSIFVGLILTFLTVLKTVDDIYLAHVIANEDARSQINYEETQSLK